jgi:predicted membrane protein
METLNYNQNSNKCESNFVFGRNRKNHIISSILTGIVFLLVGGIIIANRMGFIPGDIFSIIISWQSLLMTIGIIILASHKKIIPGIIFLAVGGIFMIPKFMNLNFDLSQLIFPAILIIIGLSSILFAIFRPKKYNFRKRFEQKLINVTDDTINEKYNFESANLNIISQNFKGGKIEAVFGGGVIDFTNAGLSKEGQNILNIDFVFGGVEIIIPKYWNIVLKTNSVFGGFNSPNGISESQIDYSKELIIQGNVVFGGGNIKRV